MKVYDVYFKADTPRLMREGLTEEQMDQLWEAIEWWQKDSIEVRARELNIEKDNERER